MHEASLAAVLAKPTAILHSFFAVSIDFWYAIVDIDATEQANYCAANEIHDS